MRSSISSGIAAKLTAAGAQPGYLVEIETAAGTFLRYTSLDQGHTFADFEWLYRQLKVSNLKWDGSVMQSATIELEDADRGLWALALTYQLSRARIRLWQAYGGVPDEAEPLMAGRAGRIARNGLMVEITASNGLDVQTSPRERVQDVVNPIFLLPDGKVQFTGGQRWVLRRPNSAAV